MQHTMRRAVIVDAVRTASGKGKPGGAFSEVHPVNLLADTLQALVTRTGIDPALIEDVIAGCVSQARVQAGNVARHAALAAGLPESVAGTTVSRACGSSQQAVQFAVDGVIAGSYDVVIASGVEVMSQVPMGAASDGADFMGSRIASRYPEGMVGQGIAAERLAVNYDLSRAEMDAYSARSHQRAAEAASSGAFDAELIPVNTPAGVVKTDETVRPTTTPEGLAGLNPAFKTDETVTQFPEVQWGITAGNSSPLTDAASAVLIMEERVANALGLTPKARFVAGVVAGVSPIDMLTGPIPATRKVLERAGLQIDDIDAFEVNEAFASVPLAWQREFGVADEKLNPRGGAIALGHAIGASGARLLTTLVHHLEQQNLRYGLQTMCEHGGMANAYIIERLAR